MMTICVNVEPYLAHYMYARYANCIREGAIKLSHRTNLYHILLELTAPRPQNISWRDIGNLTFALPVPDIGKDPRTYNYLSGESIRLLSVKINRQMRREMIEYMSAVPGLVQENPSVGYLPTEEEEIIRRFIIYLIGRYMGASPKKGDSYSWVPNHLQDANGDLAPRSFLKCYACAAKVMLQNPKTQSTTALLTASSIQGAVQEVSADRVAELKEDFPWLENLKTVLEGETLLMPGMEFRKKMKQLLDMDTKVKPPVRTVEELMNLLMSLGIIQKNTDERINMPEIYLHGFGLRRKGGLRRPK